MADEKTPKPRIELGEKDRAAAGAAAPAPEAPAPKTEQPGAEEDERYTVADAARDGARGARSWVRRTFPGHENAFWGGVCGLVAAVLLFALGLWRFLVIAVLVVAGVAAGQALDGDPKIVNALRRIFNRNH